MRDFADILLMLLGAMMVVSGCLGVALIGPASGFVFWLGVILIVIGLLINALKRSNTSH